MLKTKEKIKIYKLIAITIKKRENEQEKKK